MSLTRIGEWRGQSIEVTARLIPKFLWTTASIDLFVNSTCVLRTGGKMKVIGSSSARFEDSGTAHDVELRWGWPRPRWFPIKVLIDGDIVADSRAFVENWPLAQWPTVAVLAALVWIFSQW